MSLNLNKHELYWMVDTAANLGGGSGAMIVL